MSQATGIPLDLTSAGYPSPGKSATFIAARNSHPRATRRGDWNVDVDVDVDVTRTRTRTETETETVHFSHFANDANPVSPAALSHGAWTRRAGCSRHAAPLVPPARR